MTIYYCTRCEQAHSNVLPLPCRPVWFSLDTAGPRVYAHGELAGGSHDVSSSAQRARADDDASAVHGERSVSADHPLPLDSPVRSVRSWTVR